jgi:DNA-binding NarL/FixJ family response regulator
MITAIMFDDDAHFRQNIADFLEDSDQVYLAATFPNAIDAASQVKKHKPDVVIMDIQMPSVSGLEALQEVKKTLPQTRVLMLTTFDADEKIYAAISLGASGYLLKSEYDDLEKAIMEAAQGIRVMTPSIATRVWKLLDNTIVTRQAAYAPLTPRQKDVLRCMVEGKSRKMIADNLGITENVVGDHLKEIYRKLHVNSAPEAVREAILRRLI